MGMVGALPLRYHTGQVDTTEQISATDRDVESGDAALVGRARRGEYKAFEALVVRYRNDVYGLAYHYVRNREDAWDLTQEIFVKAHKGLKRFRGDASFKTWLLRIAANRCKDHFKKRRLKTVALEGMEGPAADPPATAQRPDERMASRELGEAIQQAMETLSDKHRTALVLREFEGLSYEEMAEAMGCSMGTVMSRLHHARKNMQQALIDMGAVEDR